MLQIHTTQRLDQMELGLRVAAERHGGSMLAVSHVGRLLRGKQEGNGTDVISFTVCFFDAYAALLRADIRFGVFLPGRIAAYATGDGVFLESISPMEYCRFCTARIASQWERRLKPLYVR